MLCFSFFSFAYLVDNQCRIRIISNCETYILIITYLHNLNILKVKKYYEKKINQINQMFQVKKVVKQIFLFGNKKLETERKCPRLILSHTFTSY